MAMRGGLSAEAVIDEAVPISVRHHPSYTQAPASVRYAEDTDVRILTHELPKDVGRTAWEYYVIDDVDELGNGADVQNFCDVLGADGWELVGAPYRVDIGKISAHRFIFKRVHKEKS